MSFATKIPEVPPQSYHSLGVRADEFLKRFFPEGLKKPVPVPIMDILDSNLHFEKETGFTLLVEDLSFGVLGQTDFISNTITISTSTYLGAKGHSGREKYTVAHELGHVWLHGDYIHDCILENRIAVMNRSDIQIFKNPEWQAEAFASAVLMPTQMVLSLVSCNASVEDVMNAFKVSYKAAENRMNKIFKFL